MLTSMKHGLVGVNLCPSYKLVPAPPDLRLPSSRAAAQQRSINLAISSRGIAALRAIDPAATARFLQTVIPMRGRMIHDILGNQHSQQYDKDGQVGRFPRVGWSVAPHSRVCRLCPNEHLRVLSSCSVSTP